MKKAYQNIIILFLLSVPIKISFAEPVWNAFTKVEMITENISIQPGVPFWIGIHMDMDDNWQIYWKNPGDSGLPTEVEWDVPKGFEVGEIQWPYPIRMDYPELTSYGYEGEVTLISQITPPRNLSSGAPQIISANVAWLACGNMCVPGKTNLSLLLPVENEKPSVDSSVRKTFEQTMMTWPLTKCQWKIKAYRDDKTFKLDLIPPDQQVLQSTKVEFFPEEKGIIDHMAEQILNKTDDGYELIVQRSDIDTRKNQRLKGVLVSQEGWQEGRRAWRIDVPIKNRYQ